MNNVLPTIIFLYKVMYCKTVISQCNLPIQDLKCTCFVRDAKCIFDSKLNHVDNLQCVGFWIDKQRKTLSSVKQQQLVATSNKQMVGWKSNLDLMIRFLEHQLNLFCCMAMDWRGTHWSLLLHKELLDTIWMRIIISSKELYVNLPIKSSLQICWL